MWKVDSDLRLDEAIWIQHGIRNLASSGINFLKRSFRGKDVALRKKRNVSGNYIFITASCSKEEIRSIVIPEVRETSRWVNFAWELAASTAGPSFNYQTTSSTRRQNAEPSRLGARISTGGA